MAKPKKLSPEDEIKSILGGKPPATPQEQENRMISLAMKRAEQRIVDGQASSQEIVHFLKLGSSREKTEQERMAIQMELDKAKITSLASADEMKELMETAMKHFTEYSPTEER